MRCSHGFYHTLVRSRNAKKEKKDTRVFFVCFGFLLGFLNGADSRVYFVHPVCW